MARPTRVAGFTLLEVLVALAILSVALGALYQSFSTSLRTQSDAAREAEMASVAQTLLARLGADLPITMGESTGPVGDQVTWRLSMTAASSSGSMRVVDVTAIITEQGDTARSVTLRTTRLVPAAALQ